jgi:hypothetical protein
LAPLVILIHQRRPKFDKPNHQPTRQRSAANQPIFMTQ